MQQLIPPAGELVASYGGGVNTIAMLVVMQQHGIIPRAITMADPGSEREATLRYRDDVMQPWLKSVGFPPVIVLTRKEEGRYRPRAWRLETLYEECARIGSLPSVAYGTKKCSAKYKAEPQRWWTERQPWAQAAWAAGRKVVRVIGYDRDEERRVNKAKSVNWAPALEMRRFGYWHPLFELGLDREGCVAAIAAAGLPPAQKSACTFCPNNQLEEWEDIRRDQPAAFEAALAMSRNAVVDSPDVVGLMRCNKQGRRQLHVWAVGGYDEGCGTVDTDSDCECAT